MLDLAGRRKFGWCRSLVLALLIGSVHGGLKADELSDIGSGTVGMSWELSEQQQDQLHAQLSRPLPDNADTAQAELYFRQQLMHAKHLGDTALMADLLQRWQQRLPNSPEAQVQQCYWDLANGNRQQALQRCEQLLMRWPGRYPLAKALANQYAGREEFGQARRFFDMAGQIVRQAEQRRNMPPFNLQRLQLDYLLFSAQFAVSQGLRDKAEQQLTQADAFAQVLLRDNGNLPDAERRLLVQQSYLNYLECKARLKLSLADNPAALQALRQLNDYYRSHDSGRTPVALARMEVDYLIGVGRFPTAYDKLQQIKKLQPLSAPLLDTPSMQTLNREVRVLMGMGRWHEASQLLQWMEAHSGADVPGQQQLPGSALRSLLALQQNQPLEAEQFARQSLNINNRHYNPEHFYSRRSAGLLAAALLQQHRESEAGALFQQAYQAYRNPQGLNRAQLDNGLEPLFRQIILSAYLEWLGSQMQDSNHFDLSFQIADLLHNSSVQQSVNESAARMVAGQKGLGDLVRTLQNEQYSLSAGYDALDRMAQLPAQEQDAAHINALRGQLAVTQQQLEQHKATLRQQFPNYDLLTNPPAAPVSVVTHLLHPGETLISLLPGPRGVDVWALAADGRHAFHHADLPSTALDGMVNALRATLDPQHSNGRSDHFDRRDAYRLYQTLLAPVSQVLQGQQALVFSTSGALARLPMGLLLTEPVDERQPLSQLPWLIRQASISHLPSVSSLVALRQWPANHQPNRRMLVAFGDPQFDLQAGQNSGNGVRDLQLPRSMDKQLANSLQQDYRLVPPLPETRNEIAAMVNALHADPQQDVFLGRAATRRQVMTMRLDNRMVVDFSTHGLVAGDLPGLDQPALAMAATDQPGESPLLTLQDIMQLKLNADWVILSACNTAAADGRSAEALSGLGRGFFYAGTRSLLLTHWAVESDSAQLLVSKVFQYYAAHPGQRAEALRQAQLQMIAGQRYAHPMFWAAYALVGDGSDQ